MSKKDLPAYCVAFYIKLHNSELQVGAPVTPALGNVHTNFRFSTFFLFWVRRPCGTGRWARPVLQPVRTAAFDCCNVFWSLCCRRLSGFWSQDTCVGFTLATKHLDWSISMTCWLQPAQNSISLSLSATVRAVFITFTQSIWCFQLILTVYCDS